MWWIVGALVVVPLLLLAVVLAGLRRRLAELDRVAALAQEQVEHAQRGLPDSVARLQATLAELQSSAAARSRPGVEGAERPSGAVGYRAGVERAGEVGGG